MPPRGGGVRRLDCRADVPVSPWGCVEEQDCGNAAQRGRSNVVGCARARGEELAGLDTRILNMPGLEACAGVLCLQPNVVERVHIILS